MSSPTTGTLPPKTYLRAVRAVDAQGNVSPAVFFPLGIYFQDVAPAAPTGLVADSSGATLRLSWTPVASSTLPFTRPVAGYEVYVDGELVDRVATARSVLPLPGSGTHTIGVRAFNAVGRHAEVLAIRHTVR